MNALLFGFMTDTKEAFNELVNNALLVLGGFVVGYVLGGIIAWLIGRYSPKLKANVDLQTPCRWVGGIIVALIVAMVVFTGKGKPIGEGGDGKGTPNNGGDGKTNPTTPITPPDKVDPKITPKIDIKPADVTLRVTILGGGDVMNERFYLLDDDRTPKTFAELKTAISERQKNEKGKVVVAILFPTKNVLPRDHIAVTQVGKWAAEDAGLDVVFPAVK